MCGAAQAYPDECLSCGFGAGVHPMPPTERRYVVTCEDRTISEYVTIAGSEAEARANVRRGSYERGDVIETVHEDITGCRPE